MPLTCSCWLCRGLTKPGAWQTPHLAQSSPAQLICSFPPGTYVPTAVYTFSVFQKVPMTLNNGRFQGRAPIYGYTTAKVAQLPPFQAPGSPVPRCVGGSCHCSGSTPPGLPQ